MTFVSWQDLPADTVGHHHCVATWETTHDPRHWADPTTMQPHAIVWTWQEGIEWMREQLQRVEAESVGDERDLIRDWLGQWDPGVEPAGGVQAGSWQRWANTMRNGSWLMLPVFTGVGSRKLVLQVICYADDGCRTHQRPAVAVAAPGRRS